MLLTRFRNKFFRDDSLPEPPPWVTGESESSEFNPVTVGRNLIRTEFETDPALRDVHVASIAMMLATVSHRDLTDPFECHEIADDLVKLIFET